MSSQSNNTNFYLSLAIIAILYHVHITLTSVRDMHRILAYTIQTEATDEPTKCSVQVSDMISKFAIFEKRFNARQIFNAHQLLVEPKVEPINCRVKVSDMNARFDTFETLLNEALNTPIKNGASIDKCHCNEDEKYKSNISTNKIDIELKEAQETMAIIEEAQKAMAVEEAQKAMAVEEAHKVMAQEEACKAMENVQNAQQ